MEKVLGGVRPWRAVGRVQRATYVASSAIERRNDPGHFVFPSPTAGACRQDVPELGGRSMVIVSA